MKSFRNFLFESEKPELSKEKIEKNERDRVGPLQITIDGIPWWMKGSFAQLLLGPRTPRAVIEMERSKGPARNKSGRIMVSQRSEIKPMPPTSDRDFEDLYNHHKDVKILNKKFKK